MSIISNWFDWMIDQFYERISTNCRVFCNRTNLDYRRQQLSLSSANTNNSISVRLFFFSCCTIRFPLVVVFECRRRKYWRNLWTIFASRCQKSEKEILQRIERNLHNKITRNISFMFCRVGWKLKSSRGSYRIYSISSYKHCAQAESELKKEFLHNNNNECIECEVDMVEPCRWEISNFDKLRRQARKCCGKWRVKEIPWRDSNFTTRPRTELSRLIWNVKFQRKKKLVRCEWVVTRKHLKNMAVMLS